MKKTMDKIVNETIFANCPICNFTTKTEKNMQNNLILTCFVLALKETVKKINFSCQKSPTFK